MNRLFAVLALLLSLTAAHAQSTINPNSPATDSALNSAPLRSNFANAYNDINGLLGMHASLTLGSCPGTPLVGEDCLVVLSGTVNLWYKYTGVNGWVLIGTIDPATNPPGFTFGLSAASLAATLPLTVGFNSGQGTVVLNYDSNFTTVGGLLAFNTIPSGNLLANVGPGALEPTSTTPTAWLNSWCSSTQYTFPQAGAGSSWACGTISQLLIAGTGINLSGTGQVTIALANQIVAGGPTGDAAHIPAITYNAQGQLLVVSSVPVNPFAQIASPTANAIYKGNGSSAPVASALTDNGTEVMVGNSEFLDISNSALTIEVLNDGTTGTTTNLLVKLTAAGNAITPLTTDTSGVIGIAATNTGTTGSADVAVAAKFPCTFDAGGATAAHYVQISSTVAGTCHDAGASFPASNQVIGRVLQTGSGGTNIPVLLELQR